MTHSEAMECRGSSFLPAVAGASLVVGREHGPSGEGKRRLAHLKGAPGRWTSVVAGFLLATIAAGCGGDPPRVPAAYLAEQPWSEVVAQARGTEVVWRLWRGDPSINAYIDNWVAPRLLEMYDIRLVTVEGQGQELVNQLVVEKQAGATGRADLLWINGETFRNLREAELLDGPWSHVIPAGVYVDSASPIVARDFERDPAGYESPWGRVQFALIYDTIRTPNPPRTVAELGAWIDAHPGRFTHDQSFTGITFLKMLMYALDGGVQAFQGGFEEGRYSSGRDALWGWLDAHQQGFWRGSATYPPEVADLHRLFANNEVDFSMSNNENEVVTKVRQGILPPTSKPLLLRDGTIANTHFLGIPFNAPNAAGAMVVADFLLSPEAQIEKLRPDVWADGTVLDINRLPPPWQERFASLGADPRALPVDSLQRYAVPEVAPEYHERLSADWLQRIRR